MKKIYLFAFLTFALAQISLAQEIQNRAVIILENQKQTVIKNQNTQNTKGLAQIPLATPIGTTNFDVQTNASIGRRLISRNNGTFSSVWMQYHGADLPAAPERGTGYNFFDGTNWAFPTLTTGNTKIDGTQRTGFPAIVDIGANDFVINHLNLFGGGYFAWKNPKGTANTGWTANHIAEARPLILPKAVASGDYIHIVGLVYDATSGIRGFPIYMKSPDQGTTWSAATTLPGTDDTFFKGISYDSYSIDANGSTVAILFSALLDDFVLLKSTDNGNTWTKTIIADSPSDLYDWGGGTIIDEDGDLLADTLITVESADVVVDDTGVVHVAFATIRILDQDAADNAAIPFNSYDNAIHYWNDNMPAGHYNGAADMTNGKHELYISSQTEKNIGYTPDLNNNGTLDIEGAGYYGYGGWCSTPSIALSPTGEIIVAYTAVAEGNDFLKNDAIPSPQNFRHIFMVMRATNGNWYKPVNVTKVDGKQAENVFCSLVKNTYNGKVYMQYLWDDEPGVHLLQEPPGSGNENPVSLNYILSKSIDLTDLEYLSNTPLEALDKISIYPNPAEDFIKVNNTQQFEYKITNIFGQVVMKNNTVNSEKINIKNLANGTYFITIKAKNEVNTMKFIKL